MVNWVYLINHFKAKLLKLICKKTMKNLILLCGLLIYFFVNGFINEEDKASEAFNSVIEKTSKKINDKYHFAFIGSGGGSKNGKFWFIGLSFNRFGSTLDISEGRKLIVTIAEEFLTEINLDKNVANYFDPFPLTEKNIELDIFTFSEEEDDIIDPGLAVISLRNGDISYITTDEDLMFKPITRESYSDALKIVKDNNQLGLSN
jgi:hypothetical protein